MIKVEMDGLAELHEALRELPNSTAKNVLRRVGREVLAPIAETARRLAPVDAGDLRDSIAVSTKLSGRQRGLHKKDGPDDVEVYAGPGQAEGASGALPHAHMQEFGTEHNPPQPFMRPAWEQGKNQMIDAIKEQLWAEIQKAAGRQARKAAREG